MAHGLAALIKHILTAGKFRYSGPDFEQTRCLVLNELSEFCPRGTFQKSRKGWRMQNAYLRAWISEAAYITRCFRVAGGHLVLDQPPLWYIRIPRAASTALSRSILLTKYPNLEKFSPSAEQINFLTDLHLQRSSLHYSTATRVFTVVRNPYSRIVSVYRQFFERPSASFLYEDYLFGVFRKNMSLEEFANVLQLIPDRLKDQHVRPQHTFLKHYEKNDIPIDVMKLEEPKAIDALLKGVGRPFESFNESETPYDYRTYLSPRTRDIVYAIYREDFRRFGYAHDPASE